MECPNCSGHGKVNESETVVDGTVQMTSHDCPRCGGDGEVDPSETDNSYADRL